MHLQVGSLGLAVPSTHVLHSSAASSGSLLLLHLH